MIQKITFLLLFLLVISCDSNNQDLTDNPIENPPPTEAFYFPPLNSDVWETQAIEDQNWNLGALDGLQSFLVDSGTKAFLIVKNGRIVLEEYYNGAAKEDRHPWFSAGKTLTAFTVGLAQQEGLLSVTDRVSDYLGTSWTNMPQEKEALITINHLLTMSSGGDYTQGNWHCTDSECLNYLNDAGTFWFYHNAFYTLLQPVLNAALPQGFDAYFNQNLRTVIGMRGFWVESGFNRFYASDARSMARFGLLSLQKGNWDGNQLINSNYFEEMVNTSQEHNKSYGYLWWLNGKESYRVPGSDVEFNGMLIPNAPKDLIAGLGANDQKLYVIPSRSLVIIRLGEDGGTSPQGPSNFDNQLWEKIAALIN